MSPEDPESWREDSTGSTRCFRQPDSESVPRGPRAQGRPRRPAAPLRRGTEVTPVLNPTARGPRGPALPVMPCLPPPAPCRAY